MRYYCTAIVAETFESVSRHLVFATIALTLVAASGCSDGRPTRFRVSGQVLVDGKPLTYGFVRFVPEGARPSTGRIREQGRFTLTCYGKEDGVVPGVHRVEVNAGESITSSQTKWHAPKRYSQYSFSGLTEEVTESTDSLVIDLTWDGGEPFIEKH